MSTGLMGKVRSGCMRRGHKGGGTQELFQSFSGKGQVSSNMRIVFATDKLDSWLGKVMRGYTRRVIFM